MFTYFALLISYVYNVLYSIVLCVGLCQSDIARPGIYIFLIPFLYFRFVCVVCIVLKWLDITCYIAALSELETQAFHYTCNNIC